MYINLMFRVWRGQTEFQTIVSTYQPSWAPSHIVGLILLIFSASSYMTSFSVGAADRPSFRRSLAPAVLDRCLLSISVGMESLVTPRGSPEVSVRVNIIKWNYNEMIMVTLHQSSKEKKTLAHCSWVPMGFWSSVEPVCVKWVWLSVGLYYTYEQNC